jgi:hypothetical protein
MLPGAERRRIFGIWSEIVVSLAVDAAIWGQLVMLDTEAVPLFGRPWGRCVFEPGAKWDWV